MNPHPDLHDQLSEIAQHGSRTLRARPVDAVISRGRQRRRRARVATGAAAVAVAAVAVTTAALASTPQTPDAPAAAPATAVATVSAAPSPVASGALTGTLPVTLLLPSGNAVVAGADDDDHVLADTGQTKQYPGEDNAARGRWLLRPDGRTYAIALAEARPAGQVCMTGSADGTLRIQLCGNRATQRFTLDATEDPQVFALSLNGAEVLVDAGDQLTTRGAGTLAELRITPAR